MALRGVKVLDFTRVLAGPFCTMLLGDAGASILKIEKPPRLLQATAKAGAAKANEWIKQHWYAKGHHSHPPTAGGGGDDSRRFGPPFLPNGANGGSEDERLSTYYLAINRNKKSIALDLQKEEGRELARKLAVDWADVVVENFKPGTMEKLGLSYEKDLKPQNPGLVYCSISGYGPQGPWSKLPGYDVVISGTHGLMSVTGNGDQPAKVGVAMTDIVTGTFAHGAILTALHAKNAHPQGMGQRVDVSLMESQLACLSSVAAGALNAPLGTPPPGRRGTAHESIVPYQAFLCQDGGHIVVGTGNDKQFRYLCETLGVEHLADEPRFATNANRVEARDELIPLLEKAFLAKTRDEWWELLQGHGFPVGPVRDIVESFNCEQAVARNMALSIDHPIAGKVVVPGHPVKYSESPIADGGAASKSGSGGGSMPIMHPPMLGEHTEEVLVDLLGMKENEIHALEDEGIISCWDPVNEDYANYITEDMRA